MTMPVKFLLVDDLSENLLSLEALLRRADLTLLKARSGDEALELLLDHDIALALIDVQMPGLNGFELAELMRGNERTRRIPIIFVTAGSHSAERRFQGYEAGAVDFIQKPIEPHVLRSKAEVFVEIYRQRQMLAEQRDVLQAQAQALQLADRRKNEFLAVLVHELRNPLAALHGGLKLLFRGPEPEKAEQINGLMQEQMSHIIRLVDDLLDVSRITQGKINLSKTLFDLKDSVSAAVEMTKSAIDEKNHAVVLTVPEMSCDILADRVRITQCVSNLLNNAAKYTPSGGRIEVSVEVLENSYRVAVSDNGLGLTPEGSQAIFQMFGQIEEHRDHARGGLGIGLALVKQFIELHDGDVTVWSDGPGKGSVFALQIPKA
ncbi:hybrid sensor histidine kinase/response regulator [Pararhizobium antarcticum]|uniref:histidine kinase n=1 Tax=Pararhizobium antarcticum TaxID=1798805 RepID=A0A657LWV7_9HYPH|nr:hybrid sensor histidine kinase/response regulator [Pararhizobium antarcticum]OJF98196.1 hybrid sensor histidine kinase/response regulator [Rhizobium sp. 58]OJF99188.1 hybrid sensor histidine kinase/response regulator [Pararhizobium antarcticum]